MIGNIKEGGWRTIGPVRRCIFSSLKLFVYVKSDYSVMLRLAPLYLEFEFSANSSITTCCFFVWVLIVAILFISNLCSMIPQIDSNDSCHSNLRSLLHRAPKYGGVSLSFAKPG